MILSWSDYEFARRTGEHRNTIRRWLDGTGSIDPDIAAWIEHLTAFHIAHPSPRR
jgi:hypothetical protein